MDRRTFLLRTGALVIVLPAGRLLTACGADEGGNGGNGGGADGGVDGGPGETLSFQSSVDAGHSHGVTIEVSELENPPSGGLSETTTLDSGHTHTVALTVEDLEAIDGGQTVTKTTTVASGHSHTFEFARA